MVALLLESPISFPPEPSTVTFCLLWRSMPDGPIPSVQLSSSVPPLGNELNAALSAPESSLPLQRAPYDRMSDVCAKADVPNPRTAAAIERRASLVFEPRMIIDKPS